MLAFMSKNRNISLLLSFILGIPSFCDGSCLFQEKYWRRPQNQFWKSYHTNWNLGLNILIKIRISKKQVNLIMREFSHSKNSLRIPLEILLAIAYWYSEKRNGFGILSEVIRNSFVSTWKVETYKSRYYISLKAMTT